MPSSQIQARNRVIAADDASCEAHDAWRLAGNPTDGPTWEAVSVADGERGLAIIAAQKVGLCTDYDQVAYLRLRRDLATAERDGLGLAWVIREWGVTEAEAG